MDLYHAYVETSRKGLSTTIEEWHERAEMDPVKGMLWVINSASTELSYIQTNSTMQVSIYFAIGYG